MKLQPVDMDFTYKEAYTESLPEAYEALLLDTMHGDPTLFMRADQVEAAWKVVMPIVNAWQKYPLRNYISTGEHLGASAAANLLKPYAEKWFQLPRLERLMQNPPRTLCLQLPNKPATFYNRNSIKSGRSPEKPLNTFKTD